MPRTRVIIMGAAGRDFHNFNVYYKGHEHYQVVAFTATQIPNIDDRRYPPSLAGSLYPDGIPIVPESETAFYYDGKTTHLRFVQGDDGNVVHMVMFQNGEENIAEKID